MFIAGDVGGTKTRLAHYERQGTELAQIAFGQFVSADFGTLGEIVNRFNSEHEASPTSGCFGVPGPVIDGKVDVTNLPWKLSEIDIQNSTGIPRVELVNDLVATGAALPNLPMSDLLELHQGHPPSNAMIKCVVAPGTGLGHAFVKISKDNFEVFPSEGGHANFAPSNELEISLLQYLMERLNGPVSVEHILSGPGLVRIYDFCRDKLELEAPSELAEKMSSEMPAKVIIDSAVNHDHKICEKAVEIFCQALGSHAGNFMVSTMSNAGVYLGGGIPPRLAELLPTSGLVEAYLNKGKMHHLVMATPLYVVKDDHAALRGAAEIASKRID